MKKSLITLLIICLFVPTILLGQTNTHISGIIRNVSGNGVADVNVYVSRVEQKYSVFASCLSGTDGSFTLSFKAPVDSICINVSGLNITPTSVICDNKSQNRDIIVDEKAQEIDEVVVRAPKIYSKGDTISYYVASFQSKNDISIGQVLRRLPGITVSDAGQISYKGQPIKNFYIEGLDLMKGRYGIATNNIDPNSISTIEVLENHQDIKALKDLKPEERASINLKLKSGVKGVFNLIATLGGGYVDKLLWDNELITTYFQRNSQLLATYKGNNSGTDLESELRSHTDYDYSRTSTISDIAMPATPGINKRYYYFNQSHSATYNQVFRVGKNGELGINAAYLNDRDERSNQSVTTTLLPDGSKNVVDESFNGILHRNIANGNITYMQNTERNYIKEQLKFDWLSTDGYSNIYAGEDIIQENNVENYRLHNLFHLTSRTGSDKGVEFLSKINLEKKPHSLSVAPNLFPDVIMSEQMFQSAERRNISTENRLDFLSAIVWGNLQIHPTIFFDYSHNGLTSYLDTYKNDLRLTSINTGIGIIANYRIKRFYADLYVTGNYRYFNLNNKDTYIDTDKHRFVVEPHLTLKYDIDGTNELRFNSSLSHSNPAIENLYDQYILTSYRQLSVYENNELYQSQVQNYTLSYDYKNIVSMLFFGIDVSWTHNRPDVLYGSYYDGISERITSIKTNETMDVFSAKLRASKGFDWKRLKIGAECGYGYYDSPILLQNEIVRYNGNSLNAKLDISLTPFQWLSFSYNGSYSQSQTRMKTGEDMPLLRTISNNALLEFYFPYDITLGASASHYYNNLNNDDGSFLLGEANIKYKFKNHSSQKQYNEDRRVIQVGRSVIKDYSEIIYHYDSLATENFKKGLSTSNNPNITYPCEIYSYPLEKRRHEKYRMILNAGVLCYPSMWEDLNWTYSLDETMVLYNYTCNKATTKYAGREYTAWYTLDVPISYGPYKFFGLPGLIIKIEESTGMYIWEMYSLSVSATPIHIYQYEKEQKCTEESAARTIHRMMTTPMTFLSSAGSRVLVRQNDGSFGSPAKDEKGMPYEPIELR